MIYYSFWKLEQTFSVDEKANNIFVKWQPTDSMCALSKCVANISKRLDIQLLHVYRSTVSKPAKDYNQQVTEPA